MTTQGQHSQRLYLAKSPFAFLLHTVEDTGSSWEQFSSQLKFCYKQPSFPPSLYCSERDQLPYNKNRFLNSSCWLLSGALLFQVHLSFRWQSPHWASPANALPLNTEAANGSLAEQHIMAAELALKGFCPISEILIPIWVEECKNTWAQELYSSVKNQMAVNHNCF